jgi:cation transport ATPase
MKHRCGVCSVSCAIFIAASFSLAVSIEAALGSGTLLAGKTAIGDWKSNGTIWRVSYRR